MQTINTNVESLNNQRALSHSGSLGSSISRLHPILHEVKQSPTTIDPFENLNKRIGPAYTVELSSEDLTAASRARIQDLNFSKGPALSQASSLALNGAASTAKLSQVNTAACQVMALLRG